MPMTTRSPSVLLSGAELSAWPAQVRANLTTLDALCYKNSNQHRRTAYFKRVLLARRRIHLLDPSDTSCAIVAACVRADEVLETVGRSTSLRSLTNTAPVVVAVLEALADGILKLVRAWIPLGIALRKAGSVLANGYFLPLLVTLLGVLSSLGTAIAKLTLCAFSIMETLQVIWLKRLAVLAQRDTRGVQSNNTGGTMLSPEDMRVAAKVSACVLRPQEILDVIKEMRSFLDSTNDDNEQVSNKISAERNTKSGTGTRSLSVQQTKGDTQVRNNQSKSIRHSHKEDADIGMVVSRAPSSHATFYNCNNSNEDEDIGEPLIQQQASSTSFGRDQAKSSKKRRKSDMSSKKQAKKKDVNRSR